MTTSNPGIERWQTLVENAPGILMELTPDGVVRFINRALGPFTRESAIGHSWLELVPPAEGDKHRDALQRVLKDGEPAVFETRGLVTDAHPEPPWYLTQLSALRDEHGRISGAIAWATDLTRRITDRERLLRSLDAAQVGMLLVDGQGRMSLVNRALEHIFGRTREELIGRPVEVLLPPSLGPRHTELRASYSAHPRPRRMAGRTVSAERADGTRLALDVALSPLELSDGRYVLCTITDSTERERLEAQFRQAQKMEAIGRLAGGIAHDFNNMLTAILAFSQFAADALPEGHPAREDLSEVRHAAERSAALTRQLLSFSRVHANRPEVCSLNVIVAEVERMLARVLGEDVELTTRLQPDLWLVEVDRGAVEQVLMNMAVNARDAMPNGGVLSIETRNAHESEDLTTQGQTAMPAGPYALLTISDTGVGMDEATRQRIFEPFFTTKGAAGTGLGLATCYGIVRQAGGFIWPYSEPGVGTTFKIYLPRAAGGSVRPPMIVSSPPPRHGNEHVLVVEDEPLVRALTARTLEAHGYVVTVAADAPAAKAMCGDSRYRFDLLLTDVVMPGVNGADIAVSARMSRPGLRVLFMSGFAPGVLLKNPALGEEVELLEKPFSPETLARRVRSVLDRRPAR
jgi:two-component system cell cycle sensor histidine kinase/response regulator CckA